MKRTALAMTLILAILLLTLVGTLHFEKVHASTEEELPKPSVPEFTAKLISSPPESQSVNRTIELSIKNQPSISFYNIHMRVNDGNWGLLYPNNNSVPNQSDGEYTILSYCSGYLGVEYQYHLGYKVENLTAGDKVDFQVQAMIGSIHRILNPNATNQLEMYPYVFTGETSDWSNTQTITIPASLAPSPSPAPSIEPTQSPEPQPEPFPIALVIVIAVLVIIATLALVIVVCAKLLVYYKKQQPVNKEKKQNVT